MNRMTIYGRDAELEQLQALIFRRQPLLLHGPAGVGKTLLVKYLATKIPNVLYCVESLSSHIAFRTIATELFVKKNRRMLKVCGTGGLNTIKSKSAVSLRGIVAKGLGEERYWIALDHLQSPSQSFAGALKDVCSQTATPLIAIARSEHMEDAGFLLPMFTDRSERFALSNFNSDTAREFAAKFATDMQLTAVNSEEVLRKIVRFSKGNPGQIIAMLKMAINPKYISQQHVKLLPLYVDFRMNWIANYGKWIS